MTREAWDKFFNETESSTNPKTSINSSSGNRAKSPIWASLDGPSSFSSKNRLPRGRTLRGCFTAVSWVEIVLLTSWYVFCFFCAGILSKVRRLVLWRVFQVFLWLSCDDRSDQAMVPADHLAICGDEMSVLEHLRKRPPTVI